MQQIFFLVINILIASYIVLLSSRNLKIEGGKSLLFFSSAILFFYSTNLLLFLFPSDITVRISPAIVSFGSGLAVTSLFIFILEYTRRPRWLVRYTILLFILSTIIIQLLYLIPENNLLHNNWSQFLNVPFPITLSEKINLFYNYSLLTMSFVLLASSSSFDRKKAHQANVFFFRTWTILFGPTMALITQGLLLLGVNGFWLKPIFLFSFNLSALGFTYNTLKKIPPIKPVSSRANIVEEMEDGWIVTDAQNVIMDYNLATAKFPGITENDLHGKSLQSIFTDFPNLDEVLDKNQEVEIDRTLSVDNEYRFLNVRVLSLHDQVGKLSGRLVLWRDITNRRRAEDARHQARNEMFVLLNAIASSASQSSSLSEFLSETIYQIIYPFHSQVVFIYLFDERLSREGKEEYYLAASLGLSADYQKTLEKFSASVPLFERIKENKQPLLLEDSRDVRIPESMMALGLLHLLAIPLLVQTPEGPKLIGNMFLGRKIDLPYKSDELIRLSILSDQIATLIDSDRRRKLAIALSERQRLMRDIHDSVSQKLYGLVALTEAAQAAVEAGSQPDYDKLLTRISENARQAVKELRLFLFQMQPVDLEKEGLISILHHRLAAVEGRADIKARFLADETVSLSKRKEIALYYIAQEALNNVLRHAKAKSVNVTLKQGYKYVTLEIADDGCGFDNTNLNHGGLGLKNITERVKQEKGKIKISSKPGKGTIIIVSFERDDDTESKKVR